jgi:ankyrin repeat protein
MKHLLLTTIAAVLLVGCGPAISIHDAAGVGDIEIVKKYLADGVDVNAKDEAGVRPLDMAFYNDEGETADLIRKHGGKTGEELKAK